MLWASSPVSAASTRLKHTCSLNVEAKSQSEAQSFCTRRQTWRQVLPNSVIQRETPQFVLVLLKLSDQWRTMGTVAAWKLSHKHTGAGRLHLRKENNVHHHSNKHVSRSNFTTWLNHSSLNHQTESKCPDMTKYDSNLNRNIFKWNLTEVWWSLVPSCCVNLSWWRPAAGETRLLMSRLKEETWWKCGDISVYWCEEGSSLHERLEPSKTSQRR